MESRVLVLAFLATCILTVFSEKSCKEFIKETTDKTMAAFFDCKKTMTFKSEEDKLSKMNCVFKCALIKEKFLTPDGFVDETSMLAYVQNEIPESVQNRAIELMMGCQEYGSGLQPEEERCLTYSPLVKCALGVIFKICN